ncbi:hypothetical protein [Rhodococcus sp. NPDC058481]|uniref:hypothetical protein n=1 Tax=unclassified Rhodococcus (in: high G+C Gram-positive bacteria) TaxID=192944 RepID=UPI00365083C5
MRGTLAATVRSEWVRAWRWPAQVPLTVLGNAALVSVAWFLIPRSWLFDFTGTWGFPIALAGWMYADVSATNVLGQDPGDALAVLTDGAALERLLRAKTVVLWLMVAPVCATVALAVGIVEHDLTLAALMAAGLWVIPLGPLALSGWVGVVFPYHQRSLRWRWANRRRFWSVVARWLVLVVLPYGVFPAGILVVLAVPLLMFHLLPPFDVGAVLSADGRVGFVLSASVLSVLVWFAAIRGAAIVAGRRAGSLTDYLGDAERG